MAQISKIPSRLESAIMEMLADGKTQTEIQDWLKKDHGIVVSRTSVQRLASRIKGERKQVAQQVYAEAIAKTAISDIEILAENQAILRDLRDKAVISGDKGIVIKACSELKAHVALKIGISGVNTEETYENSKDELLDLILKAEEKEVLKVN